MWEPIEEFGDPNTVLYAEDCVVLHLDTPWPTDAPVPDGCVVNVDKRLLTTNTKSLVAAKRILKKVKVSGALFARCVEFKSSESLQDAAGELLRNTQKMCILHNRNAIYNLIRLFPNAKILALLHDLERHALEEDEPYMNPLEPIVQSSLLTDVIGSVGWINSGRLRISWVTLLSIFRTCPLIRRIDSFLVPAVFCTMREEYRCAVGNRFNYLSLYALHPERATPVAVTVPRITESRLTFPFLEHLEVAVESLETFIALSGFEHLRSLAVSFPRPTDVSSELGRVLRTWPRLEKLHLDSCTGVLLSTIDARCRRLTHLGLLNSEVLAEGAAAAVGAFSQLECVQVSVSTDRAVFDALLKAVSRNLRTMNCLNDRMASWFLSLCCTYGPPLFPQLENICLATSSPLPMLNVTPSDLREVAKAVPALRYLATDSYDLRLFVENLWEPRGRVFMFWCECVVCGVKQPRLKANSDDFDMIWSRYGQLSFLMSQQHKSFREAEDT